MLTVLIPRPETEHPLEVALDRLGVRELRSGPRSQAKPRGPHHRRHPAPFRLHRHRLGQGLLPPNLRNRHLPCRPQSRPAQRHPTRLPGSHHILETQLARSFFFLLQPVTSHDHQHSSSI